MSVTIEAEGLPGINVANDTFLRIWTALGLDIQDWAGELWPHEIRQRVETLEPEVLMRKTQVERLEGGGWVHYCGIDRDRASRYLSQLRLLSKAACRREVKIRWY